MRARLLVCVLILLTSACGGPPRPSNVDLEPLLVQPGDLPSGMGTGQMRDNPAVDVENLPVAAQTVYRDFVRDENPAGDVVVWRYMSRPDAEQAYGTIAEIMEGHAAPHGAIGERAKVHADTESASAVAAVLFVRCNAVASIVLYPSDLETVQNYARRLDKRLQAAVCP